MDFEVKNAVNIIRRLEGRYDLKTISDRPFILPSIILPVTNADKAVRRTRIASGSTGTQSATGYFTALTVPENRIWYIYAINLNRSVGDGTLDVLALRDPETNQAVQIFSQTAAADLITELLPQPVPAMEGWEIRVNIAAMTADSNWNYRILIEEEDIY